MDAIKKLVTELDQQIAKTYDEYVQLHEELNPHRGKPIDETNLQEVNRILKEIQEKFSQLYPAYHFIAFRYQQAINATNSYNDFVETLKKVGAKEDSSADKVLNA
jgi:enoyl-[acyl-carrier-protein] reductase (NADH)